VYLLHFIRPIGNPDNPRGQAQHYLGWSSCPERRLNAHRECKGAAIMRAVVEREIGFLVVATWSGPRSLERQLKRRKNSPKLCLVCQPAPWENPPTDTDDELEAAADAAAEIELERVLEDRLVGREGGR
jgi:predicted GIY-YIG superfamily endonuclease